MQKIIVCSVALLVVMFYFRRLIYWIFDQSFAGGMAFCLIGGCVFIAIGFAVDRSRSARR
jgi:hypothetical protein